jgi:hypothetical protein
MSKIELTFDNDVDAALFAEMHDVDAALFAEMQRYFIRNYKGKLSPEALKVVESAVKQTEKIKIPTIYVPANDFTSLALITPALAVHKKVIGKCLSCNKFVSIKKLNQYNKSAYGRRTLLSDFRCYHCGSNLGYKGHLGYGCLHEYRDGKP